MMSEEGSNDSTNAILEWVEMKNKYEKRKVEVSETMVGFMNMFGERILKELLKYGNNQAYTLVEPERLRLVRFVDAGGIFDFYEHYWLRGLGFSKIVSHWIADHPITSHSLLLDINNPNTVSLQVTSWVDKGAGVKHAEYNCAGDIKTGEFESEYLLISEQP